MQTVSIFDTIEISKSETSAFICQEPYNDIEKNLAWRAFMAINDHTGLNLNAKIRLIKRIPSAAGLGGGSSDCAGVLLAVNKLFDLRLTKKELNSIAVKLGADVPFFLEGGLCRVKGIGENVTKLPSIIPINLLVVHCGNGLSTPEVYKEYDSIKSDHINPHKPCIETLLNGLYSGRISDLNSLNQLELPAVRLMPEIASVKQKMLEYGAVFAQMSGSGSAVFGVFESRVAAAKAAERFHIKSFVCETMS